MKPRVVIAIGAAMHGMLDGLNQSINSIAAEDVNTAISYVDQVICDGDEIFIKGSNASGASRVRDMLLSRMIQEKQQDSFKGGLHAS